MQKADASGYKTSRRGRPLFRSETRLLQPGIIGLFLKGSLRSQFPKLSPKPENKQQRRADVQSRRYSPLLGGLLTTASQNDSVPNNLTQAFTKRPI